MHIWKAKVNSLLPTVALASLSLFAFSPTYADDSGKIVWSITPYIWATDTQLDLTADGTPAGGLDISFSDLMDTTDASFQIFAEAGLAEGNWSAFVDMTYLDTSDDWTSNIQGQDVDIASDSEQWFIDAAVAYWPMGQEGGVNVFGGIRYTDLDDTYDFTIDGTPVGVFDNDRKFTDALIGARYNFEFVQNWMLLTRGDYSFGDSDGTFLLEAAVRYAVGSTRQHGIVVGYRYKEADFEKGGVEEDYKYKGPIAGFNFIF